MAKLSFKLTLLIMGLLFIFFIVQIFKSSLSTTICPEQNHEIENKQVDLTRSSTSKPFTQRSSFAVDTGGYMLAFRFYEQQTQGLHNYLQFQCVANTFGMRIVEPFITNSMLSIPLQDFLERDPSNFLRLGDLIDIQHWHKNTSMYQPLASFDHFLKEAPRDVIISCIRYRRPPNIQIPKPGFNFRLGCTQRCYKTFDASLTFLSKFGFRLVRKTCSNFVDYAGSVSVQEFGDNVFGKYTPSSVTVLINEFRGMFGLYRLPLRTTCGIKNDLPTMSVLPSPRIMADAKKYSNKVFRGNRYISVLARIERVILHLHHEIEECADEVKGVLNRLEAEQGISHVFLAMDVGKFGSRGAANLQPKGEALFDAVYGNKKWTFNEWEETFSNIASTDNPAYVANLQRTIAAKGECLIMVGGGGFQGQARSLYEKFHTEPESSQQCVYRVCNSDKTH